VVEDHRAVREAILSAVERLGPSFVVTAAAGSLAEARTCLRSTKCDLLILDLHLPDGTGLELIEEHPPGVRILVVSACAERAATDAILAAGAHGYLNKKQLAERFEEAILTVMRGGIFRS